MLPYQTQKQKGLPERVSRSEWWLSTETLELEFILSKD
jgi:hypothetical protein